MRLSIMFPLMKLTVTGSIIYGQDCFAYLFVAAMQITTPAPSFPLSKPSSSVKSWLRVCSLSSFPTLRNRVSRPYGGNKGNKRGCHSNSR